MQNKLNIYKLKDYYLPGLEKSRELKTIHELDFWKDRAPPRTSSKFAYERLCSISKKLHLENKIDDKFEIMFNNLPLEEIIALKLELTSKTINNKLFKFPIYFALTEIMRDAVVKYACSVGNNPREQAAILGVTKHRLHILKFKYEKEKYFSTFKKLKKDLVKLKKYNNILRYEKKMEKQNNEKTIT